MSVLFLLFTSCVLAAVYQGQNDCVGPYVLCATAYCENIPNNSTHVSCTCYGPYNGLNQGNTTCAARTESLLSEFSLANPYAANQSCRSEETTQTPTLYAFPCEGANAAPWAECRDAPCTINESGKAVCTCPLMPASPNFYYGTQCPASQAGMKKLCSKLRSTANLPPGTNATTLPDALVQDTLGAFYGNPPTISSCTVG